MMVMLVALLFLPKRCLTRDRLKRVLDLILVAALPGRLNADAYDKRQHC
jgi:hypothetical protein